jgi:fructose-1,6-bisphosphatase/inositol monophosphatase family enzyme
VARFHYESDDREILAFLHDVADAAADELDELTDWSFSGVREGQYSADIAIDDLVLDLLDEAGFGVLSEESGLTNFSWPVSGDELMVVVDPVDGSTNAGKGVPWFATSLCVIDKDGLRVALVAEQSGTETRYSAIRGAGALCDGVPMRVQGTIGLKDAVIGVSGLPPDNPGWWQFRALGAIALDMCGGKRRTRWIHRFSQSRCVGLSRSTTHLSRSRLCDWRSIRERSHYWRPRRATHACSRALTRSAC